MMKPPALLRTLSVSLLFATSPARAGDFAAEKKDGRLILTCDGKPVAHFVYQDPEILRPYFAHVHVPSGAQVTRTHPPVAGTDPVDHSTMHPGIWMAFGDISGQDFWRNKAAIRHEKFLNGPTVSGGTLTFSTQSTLAPADGAPLADLVTAISLTQRPEGWLLTWEARFTPLRDGFTFGDQEEMGLGFRVATALSEKNGGTITASTGRTTAKDTWGQTARWGDYSGTLDGTPCGMTLIPDPANFRPSWFHNRDYGIMVANPFGQKAFTRTGYPSAVSVGKGETFRLRYAVLLHSGGNYNPAAFASPFAAAAER